MATSSIRPFSHFHNLLVPLVLLYLLPWQAHAATYVCTAGDTGCLIASIAKSNLDTAHDTLILKPGTYTLDRLDNGTEIGAGGNGLPVVTGALTILGEGGEGRTLLRRADVAPFFRILEVAPTGRLTLQGLSIANGSLDLTWFQRGGCLTNHGSLTLVNTVVRECSAWLGGGIFSEDGPLLVQHSVITENLGDFACGGIAAIGPATIERGSWISENAAEIGAGICGGDEGLLTVRQSVIDGNVTTGHNGGNLSVSGQVHIETTLISEGFSGLRGGGMHHAGGTLTVRNSTFWGNTAEIDGGGLDIEGGTAHLQGIAVLFNQATHGVGGGMRVHDGADVRLTRSWLLFNEAPAAPECFGPITLEQWNVIGNPVRLVRPGDTPCPR